MSDICSIESGSPLSDERVREFLFNMDKDTLTGPRRMGRENLVSEVLERAKGFGLSVSLFPDVSGTDAVFFKDQWQIIEVNTKDILFGQDLCHQVPAIVRYRR